ncbi:MAG: hypothetical protein ABI175_16570 [Polyangiales bacterium]
MRWISALLVVMLAVQGAAAEPTLTDEEADILAHGEISLGKRITGGILASTLGFGVGQAVEGRWRYTGWIFTIGEGGSLLLVGYAGIDMLLNTDHRQQGDWQTYALFGGLIVFGGLKIWDGIDGWVGPPRHNARYRELLERTGRQPGLMDRIKPYVGAPVNSGGVVGGLAIEL